MKILVTGSSGFVGRAVIAALGCRGHEVRGFSRAPHPNSLQGDLLDGASLAAALDSFQPEIVYNLAAETGLKGPAKGPYEANVAGVANLLDAVAAAPSVRRVVWASSQLVARPGRSVTSDTDYDPGCAYGASKAAGEDLVRGRSRGGKEWVIFRSTTIWGPGMSDHYAAILRMIRRGCYFHIGRKPLRKSYSYIENLAAQLVSLGEAPAVQVHGRTLYLADSDPIELRQWHDQFANAFGRRILTIPLVLARMLAIAGDLAGCFGVRAPINSGRLANMLTEYIHDVRAIEAIHGRTAISNEEGVRRTATWLVASDGASRTFNKTNS